MAFRAPEEYRRRAEEIRLYGGPGGDVYGVFALPSPRQKGRWLWCVASDGAGWEHVSVHAVEGRRDATPTWAEMCAVKDAFWSAEDVVMQLHPRASEYVNRHEHTLHLWRPTSGEIPSPPMVLVG